MTNPADPEQTKVFPIIDILYLLAIKLRYLIRILKPYKHITWREQNCVCFPRNRYHNF